mgnify:CR=1 FL=1
MQYCPTDLMIGDFFTKPLGGAKFRRFRNIIMNCSYDDFGPVDMDAIMTEHNKNINYSDMRDPESTVSLTLETVDSQECVGTPSFDGESSESTMTSEPINIDKDSDVTTAGITNSSFVTSGIDVNV